MQEEIRPISEAYLDATLSFIVEIRRQELPHLDDSIVEQALPDVEVSYRDGSGNFWIALANGNVIGTVGFVDLGNHQACLQKMYVHPNFRGHGNRATFIECFSSVGRILRQIRDIYLGTYAENRPARRFYEKHGFNGISENNIPTDFPRSGIGRLLLSPLFRVAAQAQLLQACSAIKAAHEIWRELFIAPPFKRSGHFDGSVRGSNQPTHFKPERFE